MTAWRRFSCWLLEWAERFYLHAHGWERKSHEPGEYVPPDDYAFRRHDSYTRSHAVNAQKQLTYNPRHGGGRADPDFPDLKRQRHQADSKVRPTYMARNWKT